MAHLGWPILGAHFGWHAPVGPVCNVNLDDIYHSTFLETNMSSVPDLNTAPPTLGTRLQAAREAAGFSVAEIASRVGVGTNSVQAWDKR